MIVIKIFIMHVNTFQNWGFGGTGGLITPSVLWDIFFWISRMVYLIVTHNLLQAEFAQMSSRSLLQWKNRICGQAHDVAGYESGLPYRYVYAANQTNMKLWGIMTDENYAGNSKEQNLTSQKHRRDIKIVGHYSLFAYLIIYLHLHPTPL